MRRAIALSCQGVEAGGGPFGAVVVKDGTSLVDRMILGKRWLLQDEGIFII